MKSLMNPYTFTDEERSIEETFLSSNVPVLEKEGPNGARSFYISHPHPDPRFPVNIRLDVKFNEDGTMQVFIHSKQLRNTGALLNGYFKHRAIGRPRLLLTSSIGSTNEFVLYPGSLGARVYTTPWTSPEMTVGNGSFRAVLEFDDAKGTHRFLLADKLELGL